MSSICFVGCVKQKRSYRAPAKDLYVSTLFSRSRRLAEQAFDRWYILSAQHGVLSPTDPVAPYDATLNTMSIRERRAWSERVVTAIAALALPGDRLTFLAGARYYEFLMEPLKARGYQVELPLQGLSLGKRLRWLKAQTEGSARP